MAGVKLERRHGMSGTPTYKTWEMMIQRCTNPKFDNYVYYGGRGIIVCSRWLKFANFYEDMGERPPNKTLDRINVDGNYEKDNCRWASASVQMRNTRVQKRNTSGCVGVYWHKKANKWIAAVNLNNKQKYVGSFEDWFDAVCARKSAENLYYNER